MSYAKIGIRIEDWYNCGNFEFYLVKKFEYKTVPKFQKLDTNQFYVMFYGQSLRVFTAFVKKYLVDFQTT